MYLTRIKMLEEEVQYNKNQILDLGVLAISGIASEYILMNSYDTKEQEVSEYFAKIWRLLTSEQEELISKHQTLIINLEKIKEIYLVKILNYEKNKQLINKVNFIYK